MQTNVNRDRCRCMLPRSDRFFELRFEAIGGLGAHAAGQILASAAVLRMGPNGAHLVVRIREERLARERRFTRRF